MMTRLAAPAVTVSICPYRKSVINYDINLKPIYYDKEKFIP